MNGSAVFFGFMILIFLVVNGFIVAGIFIESGKLKDCENKQSLFCPSILCNSVDNPSDAQKDCAGYAYRYLDKDQKTWECNA